METKDFDPNDSALRSGENAIQCLMSNNKRKRNRIPRTPLRLKGITEEGSPGDEGNTEGSDSDSPAYNPTSPPSTVETTESYATSPPSTVRTYGIVQKYANPRSKNDTGIHTDSGTRTRCGIRSHRKFRHVYVHGTYNHEQRASSIIQLDDRFRSRNVWYKQH